MANKYGSSGNRWWVGQNVGGSFMEQNAFGNNAIVPIGGVPGAPPAGYESLPSGNAADDAKFAGAAGKGGTVVVEGITWFNINGPYPTQAAANAAIPGIQAAKPAEGEQQQVVNNTGNLLTGLPAIGHFFSDLTNGHTWVRIGEIVAGAFLLLFGLAHMTGASGAVMDAARRAPLPV